MTVTAFLLLFIAGVSKAIMDKINFHFSESVFMRLNGQFWNPVLSWMNKWKDGMKDRGEKFFGSSRFFVSFTDAWHLFQMIYGVTSASGFVLLGIFSSWWMAVIGYVFHRIVFEIFFDKISVFIK
jgi:hypothetical protein